MKPCSIARQKIVSRYLILRSCTLPVHYSISNSMGFSLNGEDFTESTEAWIRINLTVFSVSCVCGAVVEFLSLTQEGVGPSTAILFLKWYYFCHWIQRIQRKHLGKTRIWWTKPSGTLLVTQTIRVYKIHALHTFLHSKIGTKTTYKSDTVSETEGK